MYYKPNWHLSTAKKVEIKTGLQTSQIRFSIKHRYFSKRFPTSDFYTHRLYGHQFIPDPYAFLLDFLIHLTCQVTFVCFLNIYRYKICKLHKQNYNHVHKKYCKLLQHYGALVFLTMFAIKQFFRVQ